MEAVKETGAGGNNTIIAKIKPPRLEDAGLEDCALSPDSIKQAFFKAATSIQSLISDDKGCVQDRGPTNPKSGDSVTDSTPDPPGSCENEKGGGLPDVVGDKVGVGVGVPGDAGSDELVDGFGDDLKGASRKKGWVDDGLEGLKIDDDEDDEEEVDKDEKKVPILVEALI